MSWIQSTPHVMISSGDRICWPAGALRWIFVLVLFTSGQVLADTRADFPVPRAQGEFRQLGPHVRGYCSSIHGNPDAFRRSVLPYGPMDLQVRDASHDEAKTLRSLYLGMVAASCGINPLPIYEAFHCGASCIAERRSGFIKNLNDIRALVQKFQREKNVWLLSRWGVDGEYRVNDTFVMLGRVAETRPSRIMGLVPSDNWDRIENADVYMRRKGIDAVNLASVLSRADRLSVVALIKDADGIRVLTSGIGLRESGLLFAREVVHPRVGQSLKDGRTYVFSERLGRGVYFYETN